MAVLSTEGGSPETKSTAMWDQDQLGSGSRFSRLEDEQWENMLQA